ncbi:MAG TPA: hypothetical protein VGN17_21795 [Bryobacteraceae bacterium]|jgi:uncharacterized protein (TIGR03437 family)
MQILRTMACVVGTMALSAVMARAQSDVVTTYDGQQAFFSSYGRLPGSTDQPLWTTVYQYSGGAWTAVAHSTDRNNVTKPFVSGDGSLVGWVTGPRGETGPSNPTTLFVSSLSGVDPQKIKIYPLAWGLSSNGRFLATPGYAFGFTPLPPAVEDLTTGQVWNPIGSSSDPYTTFVPTPATDGTLIGMRVSSGPGSRSTLIRWRPGEDVAGLVTAPRMQGLSLSANGRAAATLTEQADYSVQLQWVDLDTGNTQVFLSQLTNPNTDASPAVNTSISDDGNRVLYFFYNEDAAPQVYLWDRSSGATMTLAGLAEGAVSATISGNGGFAWVATKTNRLVRVDLNAGGVEEILSAFPTTMTQDTTVFPSTQVTGFAVPGSAVRMVGSGPIAGEHFISGGLEFPILPADQVTSGPFLAPTTLVQAPWELSAQTPATGVASLPMVLRKDGYPFELPLSFGATSQVTPVLQQAPSGNFLVKAVPSDFSYAIDAAHPAVAGSTVVVWMTGLGPLDRPVATGAVGPANPPAHPLAHLECGLAAGGGPAWRGLELPFIGYAPGLVGVYQVNIKIPADWPTSTPYLDCYSGGRITILNLPVAAAQ